MIMSQSFVWTKDFETGLPTVDEQHHRLVDLINKFSDSLINQTISENESTALFQKLKDYTHYHFTEEEALMSACGIHPEALSQHKQIHGSFINQLFVLERQFHRDSSHEVQAVLDFLYQWLAHHILGEDQSMARQIAAIKKGSTPAEALAMEKTRIEKDHVEPLVQALSRMLDMLAQKSAEMAELNLHLEELVHERTRELEAANEKLTSISLTDVLTGLPNRRHGMTKLNEFWQQAELEGKPLSCMLIDADYFKEVNDQYGHDAGDAVLCELGNALLDSVRNDDFVARLGGDEFFIICPNTDLQSCLYLADKILERVTALHVATGEGSWHASISIGVAQKTTDMQSPEDLMKSADQGVYMAKDAGRGCVRAQQGQATDV